VVKLEETNKMTFSDRYEIFLLENTFRRDSREKYSLQNMLYLLFESLDQNAMVQPALMSVK
jgi:hypothetical protein